MKRNKTMKKHMILAASLLATVTISTAAEFEGYSLEESRAFHAQWNLDDWDDGGPLMRYVMLHMTEFWNHMTIDRGGPIRELPLALRKDVADFPATVDGKQVALAEYVANSTVDGALVVHEGRVVFEAYPRMLSTDKHNYMSISKGLIATLIAILADRELIDDAHPAEHYLPELRDSDWEGVPVRDILDMASGIGCLETDPDSYYNPDHCYYQFEASLGWVRPTDRTPDSTYEHVAALSAHRPSGEAFEYTSPDTFVLGWLIERITGRSVAENLSKEIWQRMGAEADGLLIAPKKAVPIVHGGISSTLRDVARFGLLFTPSGRSGDAPVISDAYLDKIQNGGRPEIFNAARQEPEMINGEAPKHNSYQWDFVMQDGDFFKGGFGGQGLYISPSRDLVIAFFGAFDENGVGHEMIDISRQLSVSGLF